ncbi:hypothetical protein [Pseudobacteriovorax antillogorgiicola]|uniref:Uncharacterized protein n=1 Tax=Pseudobacteriovorax antillogorgiicola TaxID=1513793 RepID=A0A1Y6BB64_9BACT|nr:hypothetical protein [Pseudobacteriovorax antillogorgiicola]TCS58843.1 hypothetical protein EDD56_102358 [Pseudobacteriovorax antillogorgiicola]SME94076.1 hypothetical protein SAMN06296036_10285 [Pseudobacteriovorax antillogorgiicola]
MHKLIVVNLTALLLGSSLVACSDQVTQNRPSTAEESGSESQGELENKEANRIDNLLDREGNNPNESAVDSGTENFETPPQVLANTPEDISKALEMTLLTIDGVIAKSSGDLVEFLQTTRESVELLKEEYDLNVSGMGSTADSVP